MQFFVITACLIAAVAATASIDLLASWEGFKVTHGKSYSSKTEEVRRLHIFQQNLREIEEHNRKYEAGNSTYFMGINQFTDLTNDEFRQLYSMQAMPSFNSSVPRTKFVKKIGASVPDSIDWRSKGAVTPVGDQKQCAACWAFCTGGALEAAYFFKYNKLVSFSKQQLVDCCDTSYGAFGCRGGQLNPAYNYIEEFGLELESDYPYENQDGTCRHNKSKTVEGSKISSFVDIDHYDEDALLEAVGTVGPVAVTIYSQTIKSYAGGIFDDASCKLNRVDHGVLAVGYGTENDLNYWIVKNSWGPTWGEKGYIRFAMAVNMCNIALEPAYPTL